jgi:hypothetical protein
MCSQTDDTDQTPELSANYMVLDTPVTLGGRALRKGTKLAVVYEPEESVSMEDGQPECPPVDEEHIRNMLIELHGPSFGRVYADAKQVTNGELGVYNPKPIEMHNWPSIITAMNTHHDGDRTIGVMKRMAAPGYYTGVMDEPLLLIHVMNHIWVISLDNIESGIAAWTVMYETNGVNKATNFRALSESGMLPLMYQFDEAVHDAIRTAQAINKSVYC